MYAMKRATRPRSFLYSSVMRLQIALNSSGRAIGTVAAAGDDDRLEVLAAVDRAEALATERVIAVVHHARDAQLLLAGGTDRRHADVALAAEPRLDRVERLGDFLAPQLAGGLERDLAVADHEQRRDVGLAGDDERVVAGGRR